MKIGLLILLFFSFSCKTEIVNDEKKEVKNIQLIDQIPSLDLFSDCNQKVQSLSNCFSSIEFIKLDDCFPFNIFKVHDVQVTDSIIFLLQMRSILMYDQKGKYLKKIGKCGRGPKEYLQLTGPLNIDINKKQVLAYDMRLRNLFAYDFDGKLISRSKFPMDIHRVRRLNEDSFAAYQTCFDRKSSSCYQIAFLDHQGSIRNTIKSKLYPLSHQIETYGSDNSFIWQQADNYYSYEYGSDTIYKIQDDSLIPRFITEGKRKLSKEKLLTKDKGNCIDVSGFIQKPNSGIFESDRFLFFRLNSKEERFFKIYDKNKNTWLRTFHHNAPQNRKGRKLMDYFIDDFYTQMPCKFEFDNNGKLIGFISAIDIVENRNKILNSLPHTDKYNELVELFSNINENSNPVLIVAELN